MKNVIEQLIDWGIIKKVDSKSLSSKTSNKSMGKTINKAIDMGIIRKADDEYGRRYAQIYKKGGLVAKKKFIAHACGKVMNKRRKVTKIY